MIQGIVAKKVIDIILKKVMKNRELKKKNLAQSI